MAVDSGQIHAIGLSDGGRAVSQLLASAKGDYRSFVFLSPVFREESVRALAHATVNEKASIFVITGVLVRRVPISYVENNVRALRAAGAEVTFEPMENADHFLIFVEREKVLAKLERWLKSTQ